MSERQKNVDALARAWRAATRRTGVLYSYTEALRAGEQIYEELLADGFDITTKVEESV